MDRTGSPIVTAAIFRSGGSPGSSSSSSSCSCSRRRSRPRPQPRAPTRRRSASSRIRRLLFLRLQRRRGRAHAGCADAAGGSRSARRGGTRAGRPSPDARRPGAAEEATRQATAAAPEETGRRAGAAARSARPRARAARDARRRGGAARRRPARRRRRRAPRSSPLGVRRPLVREEIAAGSRHEDLVRGHRSCSPSYSRFRRPRRRAVRADPDLLASSCGLHGLAHQRRLDLVAVRGRDWTKVECDARPLSQATARRSGPAPFSYGPDNALARTITVRRDATRAVSVTAARARGPDANGWYSRPVAVAFSGTDALSGIASCTSTDLRRRRQRRGLGRRNVHGRRRQHERFELRAQVRRDARRRSPRRPTARPTAAAGTGGRSS